MSKECPRCPLPQELTEGQYFDYCRFCGYEIDKREQIPLYAPSPWDSKSYEMMPLIHQEHGYNFYFKKGEASMPGKEAHIHVWGSGKEIQYYLSPLRIKKKKPKNFPQGEENKIYKIVKNKVDFFLEKWEEAKREGW